MNIRELQSNLYQILSDVSHIIEENDLSYLLAFGTLLGAVRHEGFIPWDDDIDIQVRRQDYNQVLKVLNENLDKETYIIQNYKTDKNFPHIFTRICLVNSVGKQRNWQNINMHHKIFIDIFPMDVVDDLDNELIKLSKKVELISTLRAIKSQYFKYLRVDNRDLTYKIKYVAKYILSIILKLVPMSFLNKVQERIIINNNPKTDNYINLYAENYNSQIKSLMYDYDFDNPIKLKFEKDYFLAPEKYDRVLSTKYGKYMDLPELKDRKGNHDFIEYKPDTKYTHVLD